MIQNPNDMKRLALLLIIAALIISFGCSKDDKDTPFTLLTDPVWVSDSLLVNAQDASGPGQFLEDFKGEIKFNKDGTGAFGNYTGTWRFAQNETQIVISSPDLQLPLTTNIIELTKTNLKITTGFPDPENLGQTLQIRMTFKPK
jgi:hypothetical protein